MFEKTKEAERIFIDTKKTIGKASRKPIPKGKKNYNILAIFITILVAVYGSYAIHSSAIHKAIVFLSLIPWASFLLWTRYKNIESSYQEMMKNNGIMEYPFYKREELLHQCVFNQKLMASHWTAACAEKTAEQLQLFEKPKRPYNISQNLIFIFALGTLTGVSTEAIKISKLFESGQFWVIALLFLMTFYIIWMVLDGIHTPAHQRALVRRALLISSLTLQKNENLKKTHCSLRRSLTSRPSTKNRNPL
jgi:hypothetical protein